MTALVREAIDRDAIARQREAEGLARIQEREAARRMMLYPAWVETAEQVAELTHVDPNAILECRLGTVFHATPINAPTLTARNLAIYVASRAGMSNADLAILTGIGQVSIGRIKDRLASAVDGNASARAAVNAAIACVSTVLARDGE